MLGEVPRTPALSVKIIDSETRNIVFNLSSSALLQTWCPAIWTIATSSKNQCKWLIKLGIKYHAARGNLSAALAAKHTMTHWSEAMFVLILHVCCRHNISTWPPEGTSRRDFPRTTRRGCPRTSLRWTSEPPKDTARPFGTLRGSRKDILIPDLHCAVISAVSNLYRLSIEFIWENEKKSVKCSKSESQIVL